MNKQNLGTGLEIAVIGMAGRFPGARSIDEFWNDLKNGVESITFFSDEELEDSGVSAGLLQNPNYVRANGILEDIGYFDASFFGYLPSEAEVMDPQMRIFHECAWSALENAGYNPATYKGPIGLFSGATPHFDWEALALISGKNQKIGFFAADHLNKKDYLSIRVSHRFNLTGPSFSMYTTCSTSLVAIHLACQAILNGECDMALAGGVTANMLNKTGYLYEEGMVKSPDGHCRAFDAKAGGIIGGNGAGVVVLKRLEDAIADGDYIHCVVKGSAINNDGNRKVGFTAPSVEGQAEVIRMAHLMAEVEPESISYVETHGTGTELGDPVEIEALKLAFKTDKKGFCGLGSVKTNIGHTDSAAGVAGFIKTACALKHRLLPPSLHFESPNPRLGLEDSPFYVNNRLREWKNDEYPLRAGVSSFGIGGTNAHVVLEAWTESHNSIAERRVQSAEYPGKLILLSARTRSALDRNTNNLAGYLEENPGIDLADAAYTLQVGRGDFKHRRMLLCANIDEAAAALFNPGTEKVQTNFLKEEKRPVVFMFSAQGSQYVNMGLELYQKKSQFREEMDRCFDILSSLMGENIKNILYPEVGQKEAEEKIDDVDYAGPIKFIFEYALAKVLMRWGIKPKAMIGHSLGEYVVACLAGVFSLEDALNLVVQRGKLIMKLPTGAMMSVALSEEQLKPLLNDELSLAAVNAPSLCTVSGSVAAVDDFEKELKEKGHECLRLNVSRAGHSRMFTPIVKEFTEKASQVTLNKPQIPYISGLSGNWITVQEATDPGYWGRHLVETVKFSNGIRELLKETNYIFVQVGCDKGLSLFVSQHLDLEAENRIINMVRHKKEKMPDFQYMLSKLGQLWLLGLPIDWSEFYSEEKRRRIPLPTYSFERQQYMTDGNPYKMALGMLSGVSLARKNMADWFYIPSWLRIRQPFNRSVEMVDKSLWLVFLDECGLGTRMVERLEQNGQEVITVKVGSGFIKKGDRDYVLNPKNEKDYDSLVDELQRKEKCLKRIFHLWNVDRDGQRELIPERVDTALDRGLYSLVYLAKALGARGINEKMQIEVVTNNMQDVGGEEFQCPEKATVLGAVRVIPLEYDNIGCRSMDIILPPPESEQEDRLITQLLAEALEETFVQILAFRGNERWEQTLKSRRLEKSNEETLPLKEGGVYLITGGLGGIALQMAKFLAEKAKAKLILTGRSPLPERKTWKKWLDSHDENDKDSVKIRRVKELEELGAQVLALSADVTDRKQMQGLISQAKKRFGSLNGVIHSAGLPGGGSIQLKTRHMLESAINAKVMGTVILSNLLEDIDLDFFVLCSSGNSFVPMFGQVDYCAGNTFLDAFANYNTSIRRKFTQSIDWDRWKNTGMSVEVERKHRENTGSEMSGGITAREGVEAFARTLHEKYPQIIVNTRDLRIDMEARKQRAKRVAEAGTDEVAIETRAHVTLLQRPELSSAYAAPGNEIEQKLTQLFQNFFGVEKIGINDDFFELGGDSLKALTIIAHIKRDVNPNISLSDLLLHPTIRELAASSREVNELDRLECMVKLNEGNNERNIFIVHPRHGMIYPYKELGKLLESDFNVYGIQARGLLKKSKLPKNFDIAAADYIRQMKHVQKEGPYIIAAFCIGDMIAYKMVKQLEDVNDVVERFIMLDEYAFVPNHVLNYYRQQRVFNMLLKPVYKFLALLGIKLNKKSNTRDKDFDQLLTEVEEDGVKDKSAAQVSPEEAETLKNRVKQHFGKLIGDWENGPTFRRITGIIKAPILNVKAKDSFMIIVEKGIRKMTYGQVAFETISGEHDTMFKSPHVEELAEAIRRDLKGN